MEPLACLTEHKFSLLTMVVLQTLTQLPLSIIKPHTFFFGKLTNILKEKYTKIIRRIPQIYNVHKNIKQQMAISSHKTEQLHLTRMRGTPIQPAKYQFKSLCY